jgi:hypothetical protein
MMQRAIMSAGIVYTVFGIFVGLSIFFQAPWTFVDDRKLMIIAVVALLATTGVGGLALTMRRMIVR